MILVPLVPFITILGIGYYYFTSSLETGTISNLKRIVEDHRQMITSFLDERRADLEFVGDSYDYETLKNPEELNQIFYNLEMTSRAFVDLGIFDEAGVHISYKGPYESMLTGKVYASADWFKEVMRRGYYISDVFLGYRCVPHFIIAIRRSYNSETWVIRATIDTLTFNNLVKRVRVGKTGEAYIVNKEGVLQTDRRSAGELMEKISDKIRYPSSENAINTYLSRDEEGTDHLYATTWMKQKRWLLVVRQEKADAFSALNAAVYPTVLITLIFGGAILGVAFYLSSRVIRRMERIDSEKEQLGEQLIRASRLAELGEMAAGFAHEINNPLQIIKSEYSLIEILVSEIKESGCSEPADSFKELDDSLSQIDLQVNRCAEITQSILKFGRDAEPTYEDLDLGVFLPEVISMISKKASVHGIEISQDLAGRLPCIKGDPAQLQQVMVNLFNNAIDAVMERHGSSGGQIRLGAAIKDNEEVEISLSDNGTGISDENRKRIFTPFFTTKPVGKGTGLGLSVCYGIVDNMGGVMEVSSRKGHGTTFLIRLPGKAQ